MPVPTHGSRYQEHQTQKPGSRPGWVSLHQRQRGGWWTGTSLGRVSHILARRSALLEKVQCLSESLGLSSTEKRGTDGSPSYTCETTEYFNLRHVTKRIKTFDAKIADGQGTISSEEDVSKLFSFKKYFNLNESDGSTLTLRDAVEKLDVIRKVFSELAEYRPLELLSLRLMKMLERSIVTMENWS